MVLPPSHRIPRVRWYSGFRSLSSGFGYKTVTFFGVTFQSLHLPSANAIRGPYPAIINYVGLGSSPFAHHYSENHYFIFSSSGYLDVSVPRVPLRTLYYLRTNTIALPMVCSHIRISTDQHLFATPRSFSQLVTSFFGA